MSWEWSHSQEASELAEKNLRRKSLKWLAECYAEWTCHDINRTTEAFIDMLESDYDITVVPDCMTSDPLTDGRYAALVKHIMGPKSGFWSAHNLAVYIWERASEQRTCDNGGFRPHMCPYGCHTVEW